MAEDFVRWLERRLKERGIIPTRDDALAILREFEEREWISVTPKLYKKLREKALERLSSVVSHASEELEKLKTEVSRVGIFQVKKSQKYDKFSVIASDASSYLIPVAITRMALVAGIAIHLPTFDSSINMDVIEEEPTMPDVEFRFILNAKRESIIPFSVIRQLEKSKETDYILLDGPLSISQWYKEAWWSDKVQKAVKKLIHAKNLLMQKCEEEGINLISIVKRSRSQYFHNYFGFEDAYSDQFLFHLLLDPNYRTEPVSITEAIRRWKKNAKPEDLLINHLAYEIHSFYIKSSTNPLVPPIRVEYPSYLVGKEDEIASYVLSTAIVSNDPGYDGLPKAQCIAHREARITRKAMNEIFKEALSRTSPDKLSLLVLMKGYRID